MRRAFTISIDHISIQRVFIFEELFFFALPFHHRSILTRNGIFVDKVLLLFTMQRMRVTNLTKLCLFWFDILLGNMTFHNVFNAGVYWAFRVEVTLLSVMLWVAVCVNLHSRITPSVEQLTVILGDVHLRLHVLKWTSCMHELALWLALSCGRCWYHVVFSIWLVNVVLTAVLDIMLAKHRVTTLPGS